MPKFTLTLLKVIKVSSETASGVERFKLRNDFRGCKSRVLSAIYVSDNHYRTIGHTH